MEYCKLYVLCFFFIVVVLITGEYYEVIIQGFQCTFGALKFSWWSFSFLVRHRYSNYRHSFTICLCRPNARYNMAVVIPTSQQTQNIWKIFIQCWPTLYKSYSNLMCLLGCAQLLNRRFCL